MGNIGFICLPSAEKYEPEQRKNSDDVNQKYSREDVSSGDVSLDTLAVPNEIKRTFSTIDLFTVHNDIENAMQKEHETIFRHSKRNDVQISQLKSNLDKTRRENKRLMGELRAIRQAYASVQAELTQAKAQATLFLERSKIFELQLKKSESFQNLNLTTVRKNSAISMPVLPTGSETFHSHVCQCLRMSPTFEIYSIYFVIEQGFCLDIVDKFLQSLEFQKLHWRCLSMNRVLTTFTIVENENYKFQCSNLPSSHFCLHFASKPNGADCSTVSFQDDDNDENFQLFFSHGLKKTVRYESFVDYSHFQANEMAGRISFSSLTLMGCIENSPGIMVEKLLPNQIQCISQINSAILEDQSLFIVYSSDIELLESVEDQWAMSLVCSGEKKSNTKDCVCLFRESISECPDTTRSIISLLFRLTMKIALKIEITPLLTMPPIYSLEASKQEFQKHIASFSSSFPKKIIFSIKVMDNNQLPTILSQFNDFILETLPKNCSFIFFTSSPCEASGNVVNIDQNDLESSGSSSFSEAVVEKSVKEYLNLQEFDESFTEIFSFAFTFLTSGNNSALLQSYLSAIAAPSRALLLGDVFSLIPNVDLNELINFLKLLQKLHLISMKNYSLVKILPKFKSTIVRELQNEVEKNCEILQTLNRKRWHRELPQLAVVRWKELESFDDLNLANEANLLNLFYESGLLLELPSNVSSQKQLSMIQNSLLNNSTEDTFSSVKSLLSVCFLRHEFCNITQINGLMADIIDIIRCVEDEESLTYWCLLIYSHLVQASLVLEYAINNKSLLPSSVNGFGATAERCIASASKFLSKMEVLPKGIYHN